MKTFIKGKMKRIYLVAFAATLTLSSCNTVFYQVYNTEAPGMIEKDNSLVYENEDCKLMYNLWAEDGSLGFIMHNKTDRDLFVVLPQTFFIKNGIALDYYKAREYRNTESGMVSSNVSLGTAISEVNLWRMWNTTKSSNVAGGVSKGVSTTVVRKEKPIICIPANASKLIYEYTISDRLIKNCDKKQAYPRRKSSPIAFTKEDTPLSFKNRIAYSFDKGGDGLKYIENEFWISELINYSKKSAGANKTIKDCDKEEGVVQYIFNIASPRKFYNSYKGTARYGNSSSKGKLVY